jgi:hypothetical protein
MNTSAAHLQRTSLDLAASFVVAGIDLLALLGAAHRHLFRRQSTTSAQPRLAPVIPLTHPGF